jgi:O-antigen ligase
LCAAYFLINKSKFNIGRRENIFLITVLVFNFISLHVLSSRTGLVGLYFSLIVSGFLFFIKKTNVKKIILTGFILLLIPVISYSLFKTFRNRITNTIQDIQIMQSGKDINHRSFAMRMEAFKNATEVIKEHWILGVGTGDLDTMIQRKYAERNTILWPENRILPHNQFIQSWAGSGLLGLLAVAGIFISIFFINIYRKNFLMLSSALLFLFSFTAESMLERQVGVTFVVWIFLLLGMLVKSEEIDNTLSSRKSFL